MDILDCKQELKKLQKANRILQKQLERSEADRIKLEETNKKKESLLKTVIDDLKESHSQLEQRRYQLEKTLVNLHAIQDKMSSLGSMVADVAHEINNPVGFLIGNLTPAQEYIDDLLHLIELYQQSYPNPSEKIKSQILAMDFEYVREDLPKLISSMKEGTNRISNISTSLRIFSRVDTDKKFHFDIHEGINSTLLVLKHRLKANKLRPDIQIVKEYGEIPLLLCFPGQLNQVFMNLLANAIDALEDSNYGLSYDKIQANPNQIIIETSLSSDCHHILIKIKDNGLGMSDEIKAKIFDNLFTTKSVGKGTGLGLAIARQIIVEKHGGTLEVDSAIGKGSQFTITIPIQEGISPS